MSGITITNPATITTYEQARSATGPSSFFFRVYGPLHTTSAFERIQPGWTVVGQPTWVVVSNVPDATDNNESCTITISGGSFVLNTFYAFTGSAGVTIGSGITIGA